MYVVSYKNIICLNKMNNNVSYEVWNDNLMMVRWNETCSHLYTQHNTEKGGNKCKLYD